MSLALRIWLLIAWTLLGGCSDKATYDNDGDGYNVSVDCDDDEASVNPGETEDCSELGDGWDNDCDNFADEQDPDPDGATTVYEDADADGFGDDDSARTACGEVEGFATKGGDCDDGDARTWPGAIEICDGQDNDCDGDTDDEAEDKPGWWPDADADGFGDEFADVVEACDEDSQGLVNDDTDCNDRDPAINTDATEICDGIDNDCDPNTDETLDEATSWVDADGDGWPDPDAESVTLSCEDTGPPEGYTSQSPEPRADCDDHDATTYPDAREECGDGVDHNCDGLVGSEDRDGDGAPGCGGTGTGDCNDGDAAIHPGATEICDAIDNDCDGQVNEAGATGALAWYLDDDGDTWGDVSSAVTACENPGGYSLSDEDCDDTDAAINPAATETCDGVDQDCDGALGADEADLDGDEWMLCEDDCDDADARFYPGAPESDCTDENDYNCDGSTSYQDADRDGHPACQDCDDSDASVHPAALEICNDLDDDCDGSVDPDSSADAGTWYADDDADGYGDAADRVVSCEPPTGYVDNDDDCDDTDAALNPDTVWYIDGDGDDYGTTAGTTTSCTQPTGYAATDDDCDDTDPDVHPDATEDDCTDATDYNCDGSVAYDDADGDGFAACDEGECDDTDATLNPDTVWYADDDGDGYGVSGSTQVVCTQPDGYVDNDSDCDDLNAEINPDATEVCDGDDNDCDEVTDPDTSADAGTWYVDGDGDGYGATTAASTACDQPSGYADNDDDCDDGDETVLPGAIETCDGEDDNCDGVTDEDDAIDASTWYADADADGYGDARARARLRAALGVRGRQDGLRRHRRRRLASRT